MANYVQKILEKSGRVHGGTRRAKRNVRHVLCAFCHGSGQNPKIESSCPVCHGLKKVEVKPPVVTCLICHGSGANAGELNCLGCKGIGVVSVSKEAETCGKCFGTGYQGEGVFYCSDCKGQGIC